MADNELQGAFNDLLTERNMLHTRIAVRERLIKRLMKRNRLLNQDITLMVMTISKSEDFYRFIIMRDWKEGASDEDMVMAYIASLPEVR